MKAPTEQGVRTAVVQRESGVPDRLAAGTEKEIQGDLTPTPIAKRPSWCSDHLSGQRRVVSFELQEGKAGQGGCVSRMECQETQFVQRSPERSETRGEHRASGGESRARGVRSARSSTRLDLAHRKRTPLHRRMFTEQAHVMYLGINVLGYGPRCYPGHSDKHDNRAPFPERVWIHSSSFLISNKIRRQDTGSKQRASASTAAKTANGAQQAPCPTYPRSDA